MTNEERAEEILQTKGSMTFCAKGCGYTEKVKELIAIGLAEGKKEKETDIFDRWCRDEGYECQFLEKLVKENAELQKKSDTNHSLVEQLADKDIEIAELKAQIEKMKCCGNCKHNGSDEEIGENGDYTDYTCIQCDDFAIKENPFPNWELAE